MEPILYRTVDYLGYAKWIVLLEETVATNKVGVTSWLIEFSFFASLFLLATRACAVDFKVRFVGTIFLIKFFFYGFFNDISIIWERFNAPLDAFYAAAVAYTIVIFMHALPALSVGLRKCYFVVALTFSAGLVLIRYEGLIFSDGREWGELTHYDRFVNYESTLFR